ncbi:EamA family transporter [Halobacteriaceae archaeon GCM10025711]
MLVATDPSGILHQPADVYALFLFTGVVGSALPWLLWFESVDRVGATVSNAVFSVHPLFSATLAVLVLGETLRLAGVAGILVIVFGLLVLVTSQGGDVRGWSARDLAIPLTATVGTAVSSVVRRFGLVSTDVSVLEAVTINTTAALVALALYAVVSGARVRLDMPRRTGLVFVGDGVLSAAALLAFFAAYDSGPVVVVDPLASTAPLFTTLFAYFMLADVETVTRGVVAGVVFIVTGAALLTLL